MKICERNKSKYHDLFIWLRHDVNKNYQNIKKYLSINANKKELIDFLLNDWKTDKITLEC